MSVRAGGFDEGRMGEIVRPPSRSEVLQARLVALEEKLEPLRTAVLTMAEALDETDEVVQEPGVKARIETILEGEEDADATRSLR